MYSYWLCDLNLSLLHISAYHNTAQFDESDIIATDTLKASSRSVHDFMLITFTDKCTTKRRTFRLSQLSASAGGKWLFFPALVIAPTAAAVVCRAFLSRLLLGSAQEIVQTERILFLLLLELHGAVAPSRAVRAAELAVRNKPSNRTVNVVDYNTSSFTAQIKHANVLATMRQRFTISQ